MKLLTLLFACLTPYLTSTTMAAPSFALETGTNKFFRTVQISQQLAETNGTFTLEFWFKATTGGVLVNEVDAFQVEKWDYSLLEVDTSGNVHMALPGIAGNAQIGSIEFGKWHHVAIRYSGNAQSMVGFIDGLPSPNTLTGVRALPISQSRQCYIAFGRNAINVIAQGGWFGGAFDEVRAWKGARTDQEIFSSFNNRNLQADPRLESHWHLDESSGNQLNDFSGLNHSGLNVGSTWVSGVELAAPPVVESFAARGRKDGSATIETITSPNQLETKLYVEYGNTAALGNDTPVQTIPAQGNRVTNVFEISNLPLGIYHFRVVATNAAGGFVGGASTFATTNLAGFSAAVSQTNFLRSTRTSRPFFTDASLTVTFWFYPEAPGVLLNEVDSFDVAQWDFSFMEILADGSLVAGLPNVPTVSLGKITYGKWYHAALRYDPATATFDAFLDGVKLASSQGTRRVPWENSRTTYLAMGRAGPTNLGPGVGFKGQLDEVRIWRILLSDSEIGQSQSYIVIDPHPDLFANWSFDSMSNNQSPDRSPANNPALFVNGIELGISGLELIIDPRPRAKTSPATDVLGSVTKLSGLAYSPDTNAIAYFVWGYGTQTNRTTPISLNLGVETQVEAVLQGLEGGGRYFYYLEVSNAVATVSGTNNNFLKIGWGGHSLSLSNNAYLRTFNEQTPYYTNETMTVEIWVKPAKQGVVMSETDRISTTALDVSLIEILENGDVVAGFPGVPQISLGTAVFGEWNNIVLRYSKANLLLDGFLNGIKSTASSSGDRLAGWELGRQIIFTFGKSTRTKLGMGEFLPGEWDEIRLWNDWRTDEEISSSFDKKIASGDTNLVTYYRFDDRSPNITDSSGRNNRGAIGGSSGAFAVSGAPLSIRFTPIQIAQDGAIRLEQIFLPSTDVRVESTTDFETWVLGPTARSDAFGLASFSVGNSNDTATRFFRFR